MPIASSVTILTAKENAGIKQYETVIESKAQHQRFRTHGLELILTKRNRNKGATKAKKRKEQWFNWQ